MPDPDAWTVGHTVSYDQALREHDEGGDPVRKIGKSPDWDRDYEGGCVFRNPQTARKFIEENGYPYSVYSLSLPGPLEEVVDFSQETKEGFGRLLKDAFVLGKFEV